MPQYKRSISVFYLYVWRARYDETVDKYRATRRLTLGPYYYHFVTSCPQTVVNNN